MTTKLILIDTNTHVVVPKEDNDASDEVIVGQRYDENITSGQLYRNITSVAAYSSTTPPVLRWEDDELFVGSHMIAGVTNGYWWCDFDHGAAINKQEARRAAEKALGLPEIKEV